MRAPAGVAVPLTSLATTVQHAQNAGVLGRRRWVLENVAARVCREAGDRVRSNLAVRDMDLGAFNQLDGRRLEILVDGLLVGRVSAGSRHHHGVVTTLM